MASNNYTSTELNKTKAEKLKQGRLRVILFKLRKFRRAATDRQVFSLTVSACMLHFPLRWIAADVTSHPGQSGGVNISRDCAPHCVPLEGHVTLTRHCIGFDDSNSSSAAHRKLKSGKHARIPIRLFEAARRLIPKSADVAHAREHYQRSKASNRSFAYAFCCC